MAERTLLVANRGEIAVRIFDTCRRLGLRTAAVVGPGDEGALHTRVADVAIPVASYLDADALVAVARAAGADLVHPGYGFLAESAAFAEAVGAAGLIWVGPPPAALRGGGDKLEAKRIAAAAGVPTLPMGTPDELGFPLLVKATAGGGGRGMRVVHRRDELDDALEAASREAEAAFGDGTVYCERYLAHPRHVEVQLIGDRHGTVLALGARDCSVQRRHQKVVEESPPPKLGRALVERIERHAVAFATALEYESAGTAEFLVDGDEVFFLELNG
ncbi:MAG: ATP-grasp domain-containing protein, partial [Actinobacteria bacterium]|nr:ATP-grasp domain-containing protein [Actinomycetota bacterium]